VEKIVQLNHNLPEISPLWANLSKKYQIPCNIFLCWVLRMLSEGWYGWWRGIGGVSKMLIGRAEKN
jgi:hypothetical protein